MLSPTHSTVFILLGIIKEEGENTIIQSTNPVPGVVRPGMLWNS